MGKFTFKRFAVDDAGCGMKISTDSVLLGAWCDVSNASHIVDLGCGSGILSLMCAQRAEHSRITGVEIESLAAIAATHNAQLSIWTDRIEIVNADVASYIPAFAPSLIISNPPYFTNGIVSADGMRAHARHGCDFGPLSVIDFAAKYLSPSGEVALIAPAEIESDLIFNAEMRGLKLRRRSMVSSVEGKSPLRGLWQFSRIDGPLENMPIYIRNSNGEYNEDYKALTKDFYLNF